MLSAEGSSPVAVKCSVSAERLGSPVLVARDPPVAIEFWHPWPTVPLFPHGQAVDVPSPKQKGLMTAPPPGTSIATLIEPGEPGFHSPSVAVPATGAAFASKRKL